jgi:hypothetical protein
MVMDLGQVNRDQATARGNRFILVLKCMFSGYMILRPLPAKDSRTTARALHEAAAFYGHCRVLGSDNGAEFVNELLQELTEMAGTSRQVTAPYNPRSNGGAEVGVKLVKQILYKVAGGQLHDWDLYLPSIQKVINETPRSWAPSPFEVVFGRRPNGYEDYTHLTLPEVCPTCNHPDLGDEHAAPLAQAYLQHRAAFDALLHPVLAKQRQARREASAKYVDASRRRARQLSAAPLTPGTRVFWRDPNEKRTNKKDGRYVGPFTIAGPPKGGAYTLVGADFSRQDRVPLDHLKLVGPQPDNDVVDAPALLAPEERAHEVHSILDHRGSPSRFEFLTQWKGFPPSAATWEPEDHFLRKEIIRDYWRQREQKLRAAPPAPFVPLENPIPKENDVDGAVSEDEMDDDEGDEPAVPSQPRQAVRGSTEVRHLQLLRQYCVAADMAADAFMGHEAPNDFLLHNTVTRNVFWSTLQTASGAEEGAQRQRKKTRRFLPVTLHFNNIIHAATLAGSQVH